MIIALLEMYIIVERILNEEFNVSSFLERARGVQALIDRGAYEGEKAAARMAMDRLVARANASRNELTPTQWADFERRFAAIRGIKSQNTQSGETAWEKTQRRAKEERAERAKRDQEQARRNDNARKQGNTNVKYPYYEGLTLYRYAQYHEGTSDKVYGVAKLDSDIITFWGRNGKSLRTKEHGSLEEANAIFQSKLSKGYLVVKVDVALAAFVKEHLVR